MYISFFGQIKHVTGRMSWNLISAKRKFNFLLSFEKEPLPQSLLNDQESPSKTTPLKLFNETIVPRITQEKFISNSRNNDRLISILTKQAKDVDVLARHIPGPRTLHCSNCWGRHRPSGYPDIPLSWIKCLLYEAWKRKNLSSTDLAYSKIGCRFLTKHLTIFQNKYEYDILR